MTIKLHEYEKKTTDIKMLMMMMMIMITLNGHVLVTILCDTLKDERQFPQKY